ncbi:MAG: hypothetical protein ACRD6W_02875 [Nitrososphaerales archaeon]
MTVLLSSFEVTPITGRQSEAVQVPGRLFDGAALGILGPSGNDSVAIWEQYRKSKKYPAEAQRVEEK